MVKFFVSILSHANTCLRLSPTPHNLTSVMKLVLVSLTKQQCDDQYGIELGSTPFRSQTRRFTNRAMPESLLTVVWIAHLGFKPQA